ncbi:WAS/WASL-interacting protein family member 3-like isoform X2 [Bubalus kerabau]|uniref:WAS/WASL-interacting protein family member 3-like isoform X2 n=1 Tax=Bubalus carabanensis TaxID=3119969 RepID=UPI00244ECDB0|nr:WAS/WASL-interacting protein family member 3-like isoform X2 [Bubalus carabanensis]
MTPSPVPLALSAGEEGQTPERPKGLFRSGIVTKGTGEPLLGKKARGSLEAKRRPVKLGSQANLGQSHSPADASQCETPVQTAHWKPRTEWSLPPTSPEVKAPLPPAMPGRRWQTAPALSPPSLPASACLAAHAPAWAPAPPPPPPQGPARKNILWNPDHDPLSHTHRQESTLSWAWGPPKVPPD